MVAFTHRANEREEACIFPIEYSGDTHNCAADIVVFKTK